MRTLFLAEATPHEIFELDRQKTLVILPVAGIEDRGAHIPLNFDQLKVEQQIKDLSLQLDSALPEWSLLVCPVFPGSVDNVNSTYTFKFRPHVVRDWVVDLILNLKDFGFIRFVGITGTTTPKNLTALEDVEKLVSRRWGIYLKKSSIQYISLSSALIPKKLPWVSLLFPDRDEHGGKNDTSFLLRYFPNRLREIWKALDSTVIPKTELDRLRNYLSGRRIGNWGSAPLQAQAEFGETLHQTEVQKMAEFIVSWINRGTNRSTFRSWYSVIPQHKSFAKSWMITVGFFIIFIFWLYLGL